MRQHADVTRTNDIDLERNSITVIYSSSVLTVIYSNIIIRVVIIRVGTQMVGLVKKKTGKDHRRIAFYPNDAETNLHHHNYLNFAYLTCITLVLYMVG